MSTLEQLRGVTTIVADTGDFNVLKEYAPQDGTTNPSHILNAAKKPQYKTIIEEAARYGKATSPGDPKAQVEHAFLRVLVEFGCEILKCIPGRVSTEVDAIHSFNKHKTVNMAREIIALYKELGVSKERVLIKIASTWEGFQACRVLEAEGIHCNMTVLFSPVQAKLAAEVNATLISPFVGRSMDWWQKNHPGADYTGLHDPGVRLVRQIHEYYTSNGIQTEIMAASLRNIDECVHLAGIGLMTISVRLLEDLRKAEYPIVTQFWIHKGNHGKLLGLHVTYKTSNHLSHSSLRNR
jgi:transaldolase